MKAIFLISLLGGLVMTSGCHAHKPDRVVVVKKPQKTQGILVDNEHRRNNYRIVHVKPGKNKVCKKHNRHWHCL